MSIPNHPTLNDLANMSLGDLAELSPEALALLQDDVDAAIRIAKTAADRLQTSLAQKFSGLARDSRRSEGKYTGSARFQDGGVTIVADLPKRVEWDQHQLAALVERIKADGEDPREYVDVTFKVSERKYAAWPSHIQSVFQEARTVKTGKETFKLIAQESEQ